MLKFFCFFMVGSLLTQFGMDWYAAMNAVDFMWWYEFIISYCGGMAISSHMFPRELE